MYLNFTVINLSWQRFFFHSPEIPTTGGIYQIYGHHPAYGENALLYIGKADNFSSRLSQRFEFIESCARPQYVLLGELLTSNDADDLMNVKSERKAELIIEAEKILIKAHSPSMNKQGNTGLLERDKTNDSEEHFLIINWEDFGSLSPEVSTIRSSYRCWEFEKRL